MINESPRFYSWKKFNAVQVLIAAIHFVIYFYLRFQYRVKQDIWVDEIWTLKGLKLPFWEWLLNHLPNNDFHFPGAYLVLYPLGHWWPEDNRFILSIPYMIISSVFFFLFAKVNWLRFLDLGDIKQSIKGTWINVLALMLITYNSTLILYAFELRPYAVLPLLALVGLLLADKILDLKCFNLWGVLAVCTYVTFHNYALLMFMLGLAYCVALRLTRAREKFWNWNVFSVYRPVMITLTVGALLAVPILWQLLHAPYLKSFDMTSMDANTHRWIYPGFKGLTQVAALYYGFKRFRITIFCFVILGSIQLLAKRKWIPILFPVMWVILPTALIYWVDIVSHYWFVQRQFIWVMPFHAIFVASTVYVLFNRIYELTWERLVGSVKNRPVSTQEVLK